MILRSIFFHIVSAKFKKGFRPQSEIGMFFHRNSIYLFLFFIAVTLWLKQSSAPFIWNYNIFTVFLFCQPLGTTRETFLSFFNTLGVSYMSSLVFYFIINYFPKRKKELSAFQMAKDNLESIDCSIEQLFSLLIFLTGIGTNLDDLLPNNCAKLCDLSLTNEIIYCHTKDIYASTGEVCAEGNPECFKKISALSEFSQNIQSEIDNVFTSPYASNLEDELIKLLSTIKQNTLVEHFSTIPPHVYENINDGCFVFNYRVEDIFELYFSFNHLRGFKYSKHRITIEAAVPGSVEAAEQEIEKMRQEFPQSFDMLEQFNQYIKSSSEQK